MKRIILEGVAGAGKTQLLNVILKDQRFRILLGETEVQLEDETFDELLDEIRDPAMTNDGFLRRLHATVDRMQRKKSHIIERSYPSYYALRPDWTLYKGIDRAFTSLGTVMVLLNLPERDLMGRFLHRVDRKGEGWVKGLVDYFGSEEKALEAAIESQRRRLECRDKSIMKWITIDTAQMRWQDYADTIFAELDQHLRVKR